MGNNNMKKNENRSLFLYTALIFIVALLLIILSFFGDYHRKGSQLPAEPTTTQAPSGNSVPERAAQLSEENRLLLEQNTALTAENEKIRTENAELIGKADAAIANNAISEKLFDIYGLLYRWDYEGARALLAEIDPTTLDQKQTEFYDILVKKAN